MPMNISPHDKPIKPRVLQVYQRLINRKAFTEFDKNKYFNTRIGYEGEIQFYSFLQRIAPDSHLALYSLSLKHNNTPFQIDTLLINRNTIYLFEIKNYSGDFVIQNNNWYICSSQKEILNPFIQLKRSESLLRQFLSSHQINIPIQSYIVFINPEFTLYNAPINQQIIFHSQLKRFFHSQFFQIEPPSKEQSQFAKLLIKYHIEESSLEDLPSYTFPELKKGIKCPFCLKFMDVKNLKSVICKQCNYTEKNEKAVLRAVKEYQVLFPDMAVTTNNIFNWCNILSKNIIRRILNKHFEQNGQSKNITYTNKI